MKRCYLVDSSVYFFRYYFSISYSQLSNSQREVSSALAFTRWLLTFLDQVKPEFIACCFDESLGSGYRHQIDTSYKENRALPDEELAYQLLAAKKIVELLGIPVYASSEYEADDLIAALAKYAYSEKLQAVVLSRDKDLAQVLKPESGLFWDLGHAEPADYQKFSHSFGVEPAALADYLALIGDPVDNIYGIKGIGKVSGAALLTHFGSWQGIKNRLNEVSGLPIRGAKGIQKKLSENIELVEHNLKLTQLYDNCLDPQDINLTIVNPQRDTLLNLLNEFNASPSLIKQVQVWLD